MNNGTNNTKRGYNYIAPIVQFAITIVVSIFTYHYATMNDEDLKIRESMTDKVSHDELEDRFKRHEAYDERQLEAIKEVIVLSSKRMEALIEGQKDAYDRINDRLGRLDGRMDRIEGRVNDINDK